MKIIFALILIILTINTQSQVLGIDFGTQFWKAALISPGKNLVIVQNSRSQRKTLNAIAFHQGVRFFEDDAKTKRMRKPNLTYSHLNKLLSSLDTGKIPENFEFNGQTYIFENNDQQMTLEQVVGMILNNIKKHASLQAGTDIRDVVLTIPANWGFKAKMSLVNAAHLAQFHVLGLINENSAAAIHYAISRNDTQPLNIVFFNMGSHNLQISIMKMFGHFDQSKNKTIQGVQALGHFVKEDIGGLKVDEKISHYLAQQFSKKHKLNPKQNLKSFTKLLIKSSEVKQILSANKQTQVYIQGLMQGIDLNLPVTRDVIDNHQIFVEFQSYLNEALKAANLNKQDIAAVQMIGGASRIPKVNTIVKNFFKDTQVGAHINGDQAMAFGSALRAANLSLTFRVKQLYFNDPMNLDTKLVISSSDRGVISEQNLFSLNNHHGDKKSVIVQQNKQDIKLSLYIGEDIVKQYTTKNIIEWKQKFKDQNLTNQPNIVIDFMMSSIHIAEIKDIYLNITLNMTEIKEKVEYVDQQVQIEVETKQQQEIKGDQEVKQEQLKQQQVQKSQQQNGQQTKQQQTKNEESSKQEQKTETQNEEKPKTEKKKVKQTKTVKKMVQQYKIMPKKHIISYDETYTKYKRFTKEQIDQKTKLLKNFDDYQNQLKEKAKLRNDFESALYQIKDNFQETYLKTFSKQEELEKLKQVVTSQIDWMDENAWTASKQDLQDHFKILTGVYQPIYNRTTEYRNRQKTFNQTIGLFAGVYKKTSQLITSHPWVSEQANKLMKKVNTTVEQLNQKLKEQVEKPLNEDPILYNSQMASMAQSLRDQYYVIRLIPRPKVDKNKQQQKQENSQKIQQDDKQTTDDDVRQQQDIQKNDQQAEKQQGENKNKNTQDL